MSKTTIMTLLIFTATTALAREFHIAPGGDDAADGSAGAPLRTISAAAERARPGDIVTVHAGVYRERVAPRYGGASDQQRILYRAAPGEQVVIKGSELAVGWEKLQNDTWRLRIPNAFFGDFNPFADLIHGDWFSPQGRQHHTGAVYLNGHWLTEAARREDVLEPIGAVQFHAGAYLLNVAWFSPRQENEPGPQTPAASFTAQNGVQTATCSEGGECIGWIEQGDWARYENVNLGESTKLLEIRAASATVGGKIEIRLDSPDGELLGECTVPNTGGWQSWSSFLAPIKPTGGVRTLCLRFRSMNESPPEPTPLWLAEVDDDTTTIWAQFQGVNPNDAEVEINVRRTVFYPEQPGINYITVRGFTMMHAATPWAPPTAEQIGLLGTHWSKGWIVEDNDVRYSTCVGISLGKYGDEWDNKSQNSAEGYVETIKRALANGWSKDNIGHHIVRNNHVSHCEQAGIVGSLGAAFSRITGNEIHDIHVRRLFSGAEMAGIKLHAAIDTEISRNHIYRACRGIWLDWMAQGARVTRNLLHDNGPNEDLFFEVNHGPYLVDHNILLSPIALFDMSQGGAFVHNLFAGRVIASPELNRETPYHPPHTTEVAGLKNIPGGDDRMYNNIFVGNEGLSPYDDAQQPMRLGGNVFLNGAHPCKTEPAPLMKPDFDPQVKLVEQDHAFQLYVTLDKAWITEQIHPLVTTELLGKAAVPNLPYERFDGSPYRIDTDWFGRRRNPDNPCPGPFELPEGGKQILKVWPPLPQP